MDAAVHPRPDPADVARTRAAMWAAGFRPIPVYSHDHPTTHPGKRPLGDGWEEHARRDPPPCAASQPVPHALNTGILCDGLRVVDVDIDDADKAAAVRDLALRHLGQTPIRTRGSSARVALVYRAADGEPRKTTLAGQGGQVEVLGHGQQVVAHGVHHSGAPLTWAPEPPWAIGRDNLPAVTEEALAGFLRAAAPIIGAREPEAPRAAAGNAFGIPRFTDGPGADPQDVAAALAAIPNEGPPDWEHWNKVGLATWAATGGSLSGFAAWAAWSERHPTHDPAACRERWAHYPNSPPNKTGAGKLFKLAQQACPGWTRPTEHARRASGGVDDGAAEAGGPLPPGFTEDALAAMFTARHGADLRHVATWAQWRIWDGMRWRPDDTLRTFDLARAVCREAAAEVRRVSDGRDAGAGAARTISRAQTVAATAKLAAADRRHAVRPDWFDREPWALNTPAGIVDLRTGQLAPHERDAGHSKMTGTAPGIGCARWLRFLDEATGGDRALTDYLQRLVGYALTGTVREHAFAFVYGGGGNGKGVFLDTVSGLLGDYATAAPMTTFANTGTPQHPTELAHLQGARLVTAQETEAGQRWAEAKIKSLTGGDPITARVMHGNFYTFAPSFKLLIAGNHKPELRNVDDAMRRRLHLVPFTRKPAVVDKGLPETLRTEWPGILRWAIDGCLSWQQNGLQPPAVVRAATEEYFSEQDAIGRWLAECCDEAPGWPALTRDLFASFRGWAEQGGEFVGSERRFATELLKRFERWQCPNTRRNGVKGLRLRPQPGDNWHRMGDAA